MKFKDELKRTKSKRKKKNINKDLEKKIGKKYNMKEAQVRRYVDGFYEKCAEYGIKNNKIINKLLRKSLWI